MVEEWEDQWLLPLPVQRAAGLVYSREEEVGVLFDPRPTPGDDDADDAHGDETLRATKSHRPCRLFPCRMPFPEWTLCSWSFCFVVLSPSTVGVSRPFASTVTLFRRLH